MTPASMFTRSASTSLRALASVVAGTPSLSSRITSSLRPAICQPFSSQKSSQPLYMSLPAWAMAPDSGARKPILMAPCAAAGPAGARITRRTSITGMASRGMDKILREEFRVGTTRCFSEGRRGRTGASMALILPDPMTLVKQPAWEACPVLRRRDGCRLRPVQGGASPSPPDHGMTQLRQYSARDHNRSPGVGSRREQEGIVLGTLQPRRNLGAQRLVQRVSQLEGERWIAEPLRHLRAAVERRPDELAAPLDLGDIEQAEVLMVV